MLKKNKNWKKKEEIICPDHATQSLMGQNYRSIIFVKVLNLIPESLITINQ